MATKKQKTEQTFENRKENEGLPEQEHGAFVLTDGKGQKPAQDKVDGSKIIPSGKSKSMLKVELGDKLRNILDLHRELSEKLCEALETDRFFITVTFQKKYQPSDEHDLHHFWTRRNFMVNDVVPSLKHMASDFIAKENPTAELPDKNQWH